MGQSNAMGCARMLHHCCAHNQARLQQQLFAALHNNINKHGTCTKQANSRAV
jgi:hypothetical protein